MRIFPIRFISWLIGLLLMLSGAGTALGQGGGFKNDQEKRSYAMGMNLGEHLRRQGLSLDIKALLQGIEHVLNKQKLRLSANEYKAALRVINTDLNTKRQEQLKRLAEKNQQEGKNFLARNKRKKGVVSLPSGLQYQVLRKGKGATPNRKSSVVTHYRGTLIDGTEFDSSYARGQPATFRVGQVIPGWTEALQRMQVGAKWKLFVPAKHAYGARGAGEKIGPHATLIFEIELLDIK